MLIRYIIAGLLAYLLGSISTGVLISRAAFHDDVRSHGSGSAGMTNVLRNYSKIAAAATFGGDFLKAVLATLAGQWIAGTMGGYLAAFCVLLGHLFPIYFGFRGGKGMVTAAGTILVLFPSLLPFLLAPWIVLVLTTKTVSIGSLAAVILYPFGVMVWCHLTGTPLMWPLLLSGVSAILVVFMHRGNLQRLFAGTENRFGRHKESEKPKEN